MSITERLRTRLEGALAAEMERASRALEEQAPVPDSTVPPLEELERILADLQRRNAPRRHVFLKSTA
ncbi:hypothetical protein [Streptomyces tendae]|uniref:hypothetical protein n=1 Tax=Streptomyces tendae TaxID=1932 RepID=UPI003D7373E0